MKALPALLCLFLVACAPPDRAETPEPRGTAEVALAVAGLDALGWLTGTWVGPSPQGTWEAHYTSTTGGMLLSANKEIVDGRVVSFEFEQFLVEGHDVFMQPYVKGAKSPARFRLTTSDPAARRAVFENPEHDFPQIITYHRTSDTALSIKVQARRDGKLRGFELLLTRAD